MFIDRVKIKCKAGNGGNGIVSFRREKYVPLGGPNGGDGGKGGSIIFEADSNRSTLLDLRYAKLLKAENAEQGKNKKMHGADGDDIIVKVPLGTLIKDAKTGALLADLITVEQRATIASGGRGGRGNWHFATGRNTAPEFCEVGEPGEEKEIQVELKLLADVGLIGFPSVGKSTFLSVVTKARPEIADYPFTTLVPNLGVVQVKDGRSFVLADLPGLIEGAHQGKGLGHQFLRHIERCRVVIHIVDMGAPDGRDPVEDYRVINNELEQYEYRLLERPQVVLANKMDLDNAQANLKRFKEAYPDLEVFETTTLIHEGVEEVLYRAADLLINAPEFPLLGEAESEGVLFKYQPKDPDFVVKNLGNNQWRIEGIGVEKLVLMSKFNNEQAVERFGSQLRYMGVDDALRRAGAIDGDKISILDFRFEFVE